MKTQEVDETSKDRSKLSPSNPNAVMHGIPGFHHRKQGERNMAAMELDATGEEERADTGTGDQPGNTHGDRFATPNPDMPGEKSASATAEETGRKNVPDLGREQ